MIRNYQKIKTMDDFSYLNGPMRVSGFNTPNDCPFKEMMILRMLVRPKYGEWHIPEHLYWLYGTIKRAARYDRMLTGIEDSWCYVTVRHGPVTTKTDANWHFDGASFRTGLIPERNYVWVNHTGPQYKKGKVYWPEDFDPRHHDLFSFATEALKDEPILTCESREWYMFSPFCLHRRNPVIDPKEGSRTFIRIAFPDVEGRDICNTHNPMLPTPAWGRDPVRSFRNNLAVYGE